MALQDALLLLFLIMIIDWIPGLSQVKSLCQAIAGDEEGARRTQGNFTRQCPGVSQVRSAFQLLTGNPREAMETQIAFVRNAVNVADVVPGVVHAKVFGHAFLGDERVAVQTQVDFFRRCPGFSQFISVTEAIGGNGKAAKATQLEFLRNLGFPIFKKKNFYHYTNERGARAIANERRIRASEVDAGDAVFGRGVYFTSMDPRHFSCYEIRRNNYDTRPSFYNSAQFADKTDYVVEVWMAMNEINKVSNDRDVYLYNGDVDLDDYECCILYNKW